MSNESIYNLIPIPAPTVIKPSLHRSRYDPTLPPTSSTFLGSGNVPLNVSGIQRYNDTKHITSHTVESPHIKNFSHFGPSQQHISQPNNFLKKTSHLITQNIGTNNDNNDNTFRYNDQRKPLLDNTNTTYKPSSQRNDNSNKNFIHENMLAVIMADHKKNSDNTVNYLKKQDYGKIPSYLNDVKQQIMNEKNYIRNIIKQNNNNSNTQHNDDSNKYVLLPESERCELLYKLKLQWEETNKLYQNLTHLTVLDSRKIKQKEELEYKLNILESSIDKLNKQNIYIKQE